MRKGVPVSPGYAIGSAFVVGTEDLRIPRRLISEDEVSRDLKKLESAINAAVTELHTILEKIPKRLRLDSAGIVESHIKILLDPSLVSQIKGAISKNQFSAEYAVSKTFRRYSRRLLEAGSEIFASRVQDLRDLERRLLRIMLGQKREDLAHLRTPVIVVARELTPSETLSLDKTKVLGFATDLGGKTSHAAIIARAMGIPAVVGLGSLSDNVAGGDQLIVDGVEGFVFVNPDEETLQKHKAQRRNLSVLTTRISDELKNLQAVTTDGHEVSLLANIELPEEIPVALKCGAEGVGLFRTEFLYLKQQGVQASEKEQYESYKRSLVLANGKEVTFRTLDLGADKVLPSDTTEKEANPFLGCRAIRLCMNHPEMLRTQVRAILRAAEFGKAKILVPMVSGVEEMDYFRRLLDKCYRELETEGVPFGRNVPVGAMIEIPSAAIAADLLAGYVDFFSIGTNDLVQYTLAVDRGNEKIASLYQPAHPAVLRLIGNVIRVGKAAKKPVFMCGEMSGDTVFTMFLLGIGLQFFSMASLMIPEVKRIIRAVSMEESMKIAEHANSLDDPAKIQKLLREELRRIVPDAA